VSHHRPNSPPPMCESAGCNHPASVRTGFAANGHQPKEADLCQAHAAEHWERAKGGVASLGIPSPTYGLPGVSLWPASPDAIRRRSAAADLADRAAMRGI
jgi:hypothetical protein